MIKNLSKETSIYCDGAIATGIDAAGDTADTYITAVDENGITVHPARSNWATNGGRTNINASGMTVYVGSDDVAFYGATARIGKSNSDRVTVDSTNGITIYKGNSKRLQTTANGIDVYGSDGSTSIASFGSSTRIGKPYVSGASNNESHMELDYHSFQMLDRELSSYLHVSDMRDHDGYAEIVEYLYGEWVTSGNTVGLSLLPVMGDIPEGYQNSIVAYGINYPDGHEVQCTFLSSGRVRFDETLQYIQNLVITYVTESPQAKAYTLGVREAAETVGPMSVCEGMHSAASGFASHAEGYGCESRGIASHSEGRGCKALGEASHASGDTCIAASYAQTVMGMNNVPDYSGEYAVIVGNGGSELRPSNAFAVGWDGTVETAKPIPKESGGTGQTGISTSTATLSGCTAGGQRCWHNGVCCSITMIDVKLSAALANGGSVAFGTIPSGYRPSQVIYDLANSSNATFCGRLQIRIDANGQLGVINRSGSSLPANTPFSLFVTYAI